MDNVARHSPLCPPHPNQGPSTPLSQPQHVNTHLVGVSLEDCGEGGHGTLPPASKHGGADQSPLLQSGEQSQTPAPGLQSFPPAPPQAHQLQDEGALRRAAGLSGTIPARRWDCRDQAGRRKAEGQQCCRTGGLRGPPPAYSQAGGSRVLALICREPREVGTLIAGLR